MTQVQDFVLGEAVRSLDDRIRVSIPSEMLEPLVAAGKDGILAKERPGCLSLWDATNWQTKLEADIDLVRSKIRAGRLEGRIEEVQLLGRLLSTRHRQVQLAGRGRLLIPEGFREFLGVEAGGEVTVIGAALCVEIWNPQHWLKYLEEQMPEFRQLLSRLSG
jgi:MraZ protein